MARASSFSRKWFAIAALAALSLALLPALPVNDAVAYWAAGHIAVRGGNPYSLEDVLALEHSVGYKGDKPLTLRNPPWTLPLVAPLGFLSFQTAALIWLLVQVAAAFASAALLARAYRAEGGRRNKAIAAALVFAPVLAVFAVGQITALVLLGFALWLRSTQTRSEWRAALGLALIALKPHVALAVAVPMAFWLWRERSWRTVVVVAAVLATLTTVAALIVPPAEYFRMMSAEGFAEAPSSTLAAVLRKAVAPGSTVLQYLPAMIAVAWSAVWWFRRRSQWEWMRELPLLLVVSIAALPYGFFFDGAVLAVAVVAATTVADGAVPRWLVLAYIVVNAAFVALFASGVPADYYVGAPLIWAALYALARGASRVSETACAPVR